jgi:hypothetical protein
MKKTIGALLLACGAYFAADVAYSAAVHGAPVDAFRLAWAIGLVALGLVVVLRNRRATQASR